VEVTSGYQLLYNLFKCVALLSVMPVVMVKKTTFWDSLCINDFSFETGIIDVLFFYGNHHLNTCSCERCGHEFSEYQAIINVLFGVYFGCSCWRLMVWWKLYSCLETWVASFGHDSFFHPNVVFYCLFYFEETFIREGV